MTAGARRMATAAGLDQTFVLVARRVRLEPGSLVLDDLAPSTVVITWPPADSVHPVTTGDLLDAWWARCEPGTVDATLFLMDPDSDHVGPVSLQVSSPVICGAGLRWGAVVLAGPLHAASGACVLLIQPPSDGCPTGPQPQT